MEARMLSLPLFSTAVEKNNMEETYFNTEETNFNTEETNNTTPHDEEDPRKLQQFLKVKEFFADNGSTNTRGLVESDPTSYGATFLGLDRVCYASPPTDTQHIEVILHWGDYWNGLCQDEEYVLLSRLPVFEAFSHAIFHKHTYWVAGAATLWYIIANIIFATMIDSASAPVYGGYAFGSLCMFWIYSFGYVTFRGKTVEASLSHFDEDRGVLLHWSAFKHQANIKIVEEAAVRTPLVGSPVDDELHSHSSVHMSRSKKDAVTFFRLFWDLYSKVLTYLCRDRRCCISKAIVLPSPAQKVKNVIRCSFYDLVSVAIKYLDSQNGSEYKSSTTIVEPLLGFISIGAGLAFAVLSLLSWRSLAASCTSAAPAYDAGGCRSETVKQAVMLGQLIYFTTFFLNTMGVCCTLTGLIVATDLFHRLCESWVRRFAGLRSVGVNLSQLDELADTLKKDSFERYLFICNFCQQISAAWQVFLVQILTLPLSGIGIFYYLTLVSKDSAGTYLAIWIFNVIIYAIPVYCLAYANSSVQKLHAGLKYSSPNDFECLGGKQLWLDYLNDSPCFWLVFGFAITFSVLASFLSSSAISLAGLVGHSLFSMFDSATPK